jgi:hypothetical protein
MRAAAQDVVTALDRHGDALTRVEAIAVLGVVVGNFALVWGGEPQVVTGVSQAARQYVLDEYDRRGRAAAGAGVVVDQAPGPSRS